MADAKTYLEGLEISDEVKNQIAEKLNPVIEKLETDVAYNSKELKTAIEARQKAKDELKDLKTKYVNDEFDGKKEMEVLIKSKELEVTSLTEKTKTLESDLAKKNEELESIQTETKLELKTRFTDVEWEKIKDKSVSDIRLFAQMKSETSPGDQSRRMNTYGNKVGEKSPEEKISSIYKS